MAQRKRSRPSFSFKNVDPLIKSSTRAFEDETLQEKIGVEKHYEIWKLCCKETKPCQWYSMGTSSLLLPTFSLKSTFNNSKDELPPGRCKYLHSAEGALCQLSYIAEENTKYTGLFQGAEFGLGRFSWFNQPTEGGTIIPGFALKFFRDHVHSGNLFALNVDGLDEPNFFAHDFSNHSVSNTNNEFLQNLLERKFRGYTNWPEYVGLSDFAQFNEKGQLVENPNFPFELQYRIPSRISQVMAFTNPFENGLCKAFERSCPIGCCLIEIYARKQPGTDFDRCGHIEVTSQFTTSTYGDCKLSFQHTYFETDLKFKPEWESVLKTKKDPSLLGDYVKNNQLDLIQRICFVDNSFIHQKIPLSLTYCLRYNFLGSRNSDQRFSYPLHIAARENHVDLVQFLIGSKADPNQEDGFGNSVFNLVQKTGAVKDKESFKQILKLLNIGKENNNDSKPNAKEHSEENVTTEIECPDIFFEAIDKGNVQLVKECLRKNTKLVSAKIALSMTYGFVYGTSVTFGNHFAYPIHIAAYRKNINLVIILLNNGANPRQRDGWGNTGFDLAPDLFEYLKRNIKARKKVPQQINLPEPEKIDLPSLEIKKIDEQFS